MNISFYKYQGAGNDFIIIDNRDLKFPGSTGLVNHLCDRRFGVGADGLMLLQNRPGYDFEMIYYNSDGKLSSMCGNGGRCLAAFARHLGIGGAGVHFLAVDGPHEAIFKEPLVSLQMKDVHEISRRGDDYVLDTGSPHYVRFMEQIDKLDIIPLARSIRHNNEFDKEGINVNFIEPVANKPDSLKIRTFERGVEDETLACGTGVVASAISWFQYAKKDSSVTSHQHIYIEARGGNLEVEYDFHPSGLFSQVWLTGPAELVYSGAINI